MENSRVDLSQATSETPCPSALSHYAIRFDALELLIRGVHRVAVVAHRKAPCLKNRPVAVY